MKLNRHLALAWSVAALAIIAAILAFHEQQRIRAKYLLLARRTEQRSAIILAQAANANRPIVVFGDSITEQAKLPQSVCGHAMVNAGISGAQTFQLISVAEELAKEVRPFISIVALGINDVRANNENFETDYSNLLNTMQETVVLVGLTKARGEKTEGTNSAIERIAAERHLHFIRQDDVGYGPDGLHPDESNSAIWVRNIVAGTRQICGENAGG